MPVARHRDAAAIEKTAPTDAGETRAPARILIPSTSAIASSASNMASSSSVGSRALGAHGLPRETLIIASRLKEYIQAAGEMNTSAAVMDVLSDHVRRLCDRAIENARADGRKTVLDRDFSFLKNLK
ncbi:MAG: hypothetical protein AB7G93_22990 [Bdellovibrionales bacterium]